MTSVFDSRNEKCKSPFGAVPCGTEISFTLFPDPSVTACTMLLFREFAYVDEELPLSRQDNFYTGTLTAPSAPELIWYGFRLAYQDGSVAYLGRNGTGSRQEMQCWQQTVYSAESQTPQWFGRGISYQIFPDRFCRTAIPDPAGLVGNRTIHQRWDEPMEYLPDAQGEIRNCDFYGGSLAGIISKLDYLQGLSVTTLYLCPIFESASNHRYNTADYLRIDPMLGTEEDFRLLCREAERRGMRVMLDGVFNHTGSVSRYFNANGFYPELGAAQSTDSPFAAWYSFHPWPDNYDAWWGIKTLPAVNENHPSYRDFIISGENSVVRHWLRCGASGWRLDVADELPDDFIAQIRQVMTEERPDSYLLGEVWEDGSNKIAYSQRRRYLLGNETHGLMNYPFRNAALAWLTGGDAADFREVMESLREHYPPNAYYGAMNFLGTHDTPRILTLLGLSPDADTDTRDKRACYRLSDEEQQLGLSRLRLGAMLLYAFPGSPTIYYGDEAGMQGFEDPFNRGTFPWGHENDTLLDFYRTLGKLRKERLSLQCGSIDYLHAQGGGLVLQRQYDDEITLIAMNAGRDALTVTLPCEQQLVADALTGQQFLARGGLLRLTLPPVSGLLLI
ncbi:MAG: glycoside hydrolase family 13 protein [Clostridiales bacterium]|nr:glycoside hydrolase family 13 protein [Candidatus Cacconaster stercorequi]